MLIGHYTDVPYQKINFEVSQELDRQPAILGR